MNTPRTDKAAENAPHIEAACECYRNSSRQLETELAAMTAERDEAINTLEAWRFNEAAWGTSPEEIRKLIAGLTKERDHHIELGRIIKQERENFSAMLHAETERLFAEREKVAKLNHLLCTPSENKPTLIECICSTDFPPFIFAAIGPLNSSAFSQIEEQLAEDDWKGRCGVYIFWVAWEEPQYDDAGRVELPGYWDLDTIKFTAKTK